MNFKRFKQTLSDYKKTIATEKDYICMTNLSTLRKVSFLGLIIFVLCFVFTPIIIKEWRPTYHYFLVPPALIVSYLFALLYEKFGKRNYSVVLTSCILFHLVMAFLLINISVFSFPDGADPFVVLYIMIVPAIFIMNFSYIIALIVFICAVFIVLVVLYKGEGVIGHDVFSAMTSLFLATIETVVISNIHIRDFRMKRTLHELSEKDSLTNVYNRKTYEEKCSTYLEEIKNLNVYYSMIVLDVDDFKKINDRFGHLSGDEILIYVSKVLTENSHGDVYVGRVGGDEFSVFFMNLHNKKEASENAKELLTLISNKSLDDENYKLSCSMGLITTKRKYTFDELYMKADKNLYIAKNQNKNRLVDTIEG